jgi:hypothetical protein
MAIKNFINTVFAANLIEALRKIHVFASVADRSYQGQITALGDKVKINQVSDVTINAYSKDSDIALQDLDDAASELTIDQAYYFAFKANDIEAIQRKGAILSASQNKAAYGLANTVDSYIAGLYAQAGLTSYATGTTPWDVTSLNVIDVLLDIKEKMARVPQQGRFLIVPEWFHGKLNLAGLTTKSDNNAIFTNGMVDRIEGFDILVSENVSASTGTPTWDQTRILGGVRGASWAFADGVNEVEAYRPEKRFEDAVKGLYLFGAKVLRPDMTVCAYCDKTAEASS